MDDKHCACGPIKLGQRHSQGSAEHETHSMRLGGVKDTCCRDGALKPEGLHSRS